MLKEVEMQGYVQKVRECRGHDWNVEGCIRTMRMQRIGWERTLCKARASLLIVLLEVACVDRL